MTDILKTIVDGIWEGFEAEDNACVDRKMDLIDTGGTFETFSMTRVASAVIRRLEREGAILVRHDWREHMRSLLGKQVAVTIDRGEDGPGPVVVKGQLLSFDEGGEVAVRDDCGFIHWAWPNLATEAA